MLHQSRYNVTVPTDHSTTLLYNTANGAFAELDAAASACYDACGADDKALAEQLHDAGFLTELSPNDELGVLHEQFDAQRHSHSDLGLILAPTYACNYRCPYCYELGHNSIKGIMDDEVIDAIYDFIEDRYRDHEFSSLSVAWYGGDPSLALDVVEQMSEWMIAWCDEHGIFYSAEMLTNCNLIDEAAADMLARCKVGQVFITIDGFEETHNKRRVAANGSNSFERNVNAAKLFKERGVQVAAIMNVDRVNWPQFHELRDWLRSEAGIDLGCGRLCDYGHFYGTRDFKAPEFDLFTHEEFSKLEQEEFAAAGYGPEEYRQRLAPAPNFCRGQKADYYVIDCRGDIYICDGRIGEQDHVRGSIFDELTPEQLDMISHDPYQDEQCSACELLPICQGNCHWERELTGMQCHPLKTTLPDYLLAWRACYPENADPFTLLSPARVLAS